MSEKLEVVIDVTTDRAIKAANDLAKATSKVGDTLDETASKADLVADSLDSATDQMVADMKAADRAASALGNAIGPELAGKIGQAKLDSFIGQLRRAGLSFDDIEAGAERFADSLRKMDAATSSFDSVEQAARRTGTEIDKSGGVMANFVGNTLQELPGLSGAFGPLNTAIGQFAEYAAEGGVSVSGFLKAAGPIAALGAGFALVSAIVSELGEESRKLKEQTDALMKVQQKIADAQYEAAASDLVDQNGELADKGAKYGLTMTDIIDALQGGTIASDKLAAAQDAISAALAAKEEATRGDIAAAANQSNAIGELRNELEIARQAYIDSGAAVADTGSKVAETTTALANNAQVTDDATAASARHTEQVQRDKNAAQALLDTENALTDAYLRRNETVFGVEKTQLELDNTYAALQASESELQTTLADSTISAENKAKALRDLRIQQISAAESVRDAAKKYAESQGAAEGSNAAIALQIEYLKDQTERYPELSREIETYIANLKKIPGEITTRVTTVGGMRQYASGTSYHPGGVALVGEQGPEIVDLPRGSKVYSASQSRSMARSGTLNGSITPGAGSIIVNVLSADPEQVVEAIKRYESRNGAM